MAKSITRDPEQLAKTVEWLDEERRKDRQTLATFEEKLKSLTTENNDLSRKLTQLQTDLSAATTQLKRLGKLDDILDSSRKEMTRQLESAAARRADSDKEAERVRKTERDSLNKQLTALQKAADIALKLDKEAQARREEEERLTRLANELQKKTADVNKFMEDRTRQITALEEGRRLEGKRVSDLQAELTEMRKRLDETRGRAESAEDAARRTEARVQDLQLAENERRAAQTQWMDAQALAQADRDRAWTELRDKAETALRQLEDNNARMTQYAETHREMRRVAEEFQKTVELMERRITETGEIQRLAEERFRQEWAAFLADDQKRWTTHMLLRDEQWREHDRQYQKELDRVETIEEQARESFEAVRRMQEQDAARLHGLASILRDALAEYEQKLTQVR